MQNENTRPSCSKSKRKTFELSSAVSFSLALTWYLSLLRPIIDWVPSVTEMCFFLETGNSKIKVPAGLVPGENPLPGSHTFLLFLDMAEKVSSGPPSSSYKDTNPVLGTPPS